MAASQDREVDASRVLARLWQVAALFVFDGERRCVLVNGQAAALAGERPDALVGWTLGDVVGRLLGGRSYVEVPDDEQGLHVIVVPSVPAAPLVPWPARGLTVRELEVLSHVAEGATADEIAGLLSIGRTTVESHVRRAMERLEARNRPHAIAVATREGLLPLR